MCINCLNHDGRPETSELTHSPEKGCTLWSVTDKSGSQEISCEFAYYIHNRSHSIKMAVVQHMILSLFDFVFFCSFFLKRTLWSLSTWKLLPVSFPIFFQIGFCSTRYAMLPSSRSFVCYLLHKLEEVLSSLWEIKEQSRAIYSWQVSTLKEKLHILGSWRSSCKSFMGEWIWTSF